MSRILATITLCLLPIGFGCASRLPMGDNDSLLAAIEDGESRHAGNSFLGSNGRPAPTARPQTKSVREAQAALEEIPTRSRAEAMAAVRRAAMEASPAGYADDQQDELFGDILSEPRAPRTRGAKTVRLASHSQGPKLPTMETPVRKEREPPEADLEDLLAMAVERGNLAERVARERERNARSSAAARLVREVSWQNEVDSLTMPTENAQRFDDGDRPEVDRPKAKRTTRSSSKANVDVTFGKDEPPQPPVGSRDKRPATKTIARVSATAGKAPAKTPAKTDSDQPTNWHEARRAAIAALREEIRKSRDEGGDRHELARLETMLRLQHLLAGDRDEAVKPIEGLPPAEQEYWKHQLFELADMLSDRHTPGDARRYGLALHSLDEASSRLSELSGLSLRNAAFCKTVRDFGSVERFERLDFTRNQEVLLYVEVRNFASQKVGDAMFETELQGSYRVVDRAGASKAERVLPLDKQSCANRRRDYYIAYRLFIPAELEPGAYALELTIEDKKAGKSTNTRIDFNVVP